MPAQVAVGRGDDAHALAPLRAADGPRLLAGPVDGLVGRVEEGGRRAQGLLLCARPPLLLKVLDALGHGHVGVGGAVELVQQVVQLVLVETLDQVEDVLDRRAGPDACLGRHCVGGGRALHVAVPGCSVLRYVSDDFFLFFFLLWFVLVNASPRCLAWSLDRWSRRRRTDSIQG